MPPMLLLIAYYFADGGDLKLAVQTPDGWEIQTVDADGDVGRYPLIRVNSQGVICIAYQDVGTPALKYAEGSSDRVDAMDLYELMKAFQSQDLYYDLNGDGKIDYADLFVFSETWEWRLPSR